MHDTGCLVLVHWDDPEGWYGEGGGRRVQDGEHMYKIPGFAILFQQELHMCCMPGEMHSYKSIAFLYILPTPLDYHDSSVTWSYSKAPG